MLQYFRFPLVGIIYISKYVVVLFYLVRNQISLFVNDYSSLSLSCIILKVPLLNVMFYSSPFVNNVSSWSPSCKFCWGGMVDRNIIDSNKLTNTSLEKIYCNNMLKK